MDSNLASIRMARTSLNSTSKLIGRIFLIIFIVYCLAIVSVLVYTVFPPEGFLLVEPSTIASAAALIMGQASVGFVLFLLWQIFREIGRGKSPFTPARIRQIRVLGCLFFLTALCNSCAGPGAELGSTTADGTHMVIDNGSSSNNSTFVDVTSIMIGVVCFAVALIFKYASTLECETDDLV